ncbi:hypothetical protein IFM89_005577 [Coptis chinensis]|uniref:Uncharacterized protein n=1 Tax=Coptis chinensis TaxID=261450 RepID=A0A835IAR0_9MAGN|nr:hypothetical protein IFM89_005577 [Coptis chinensis]
MGGRSPSKAYGQDNSAVIMTIAKPQFQVLLLDEVLIDLDVVARMDLLEFLRKSVKQEPIKSLTVKTIGFDFTLMLLLYKDDRVSVVADMGGRNPSKAYGQDNSDGMGIY